MQVLSTNLSITTISSIEEVIKDCNKVSTLAIDTETGGFYPQIDKLFLLQIGTEYEEYVIDCTTIDISPLKQLLESKTLIMHNAKFDLRFLYHYNIWPTKIKDTFLQEVVLYNNDDRNHKKSLEACALRYLNIQLNKEIRGLIHKLGPHNKAVINYAAEDVAYLHAINRLQEEKAVELDLVNTMSLENSFVPALAYVEYCGFKVDTNLWLSKIEKDVNHRNKCLISLNNFYKNTSYKPQQLSMFNDISDINWDSPNQVLDVLHSYNIYPTSVDKKKGVSKSGVSKEALSKYKEHTIVNLYLAYKEAATIVSKYGYNILKEINKFSDQRLRTNFHQVKSTGRMSSGSDKEIEDSDNINFQNIPRVPEKKNRTREIYERECFVPNHGNIFVVCDYSQQEQVIMANVTKDENLMNFFLSGESDMHSYNAKKIFPELSELSSKEVKNNHADKRFLAKSAGFAINYGGSASSISSNINIEIEQAKEIYESYMKAFPGLASFFKEQEKYIYQNKYVLMNSISKRKYFFTYLKRDLAIKNSIDWNKYNSDLDYKKSMSDTLKRISACVRNAINYPIQGTGADQMKVSIINLYKWILENNYQNIVLIPSLIHDEAVIEGPEYMAEELSSKVKECMEYGSKLFCPIIPVKAEPVISHSWEH